MQTGHRHQCLIYEGAPSLHLPALAAAARDKLRIRAEQAGRLETAIDRLNEPLSPLKSFVLPGGQSGNPLSPHYDDLFPLWRRDGRCRIVFANSLERSPGRAGRGYARGDRNGPVSDLQEMPVGGPGADLRRLALGRN